MATLKINLPVSYNASRRENASVAGLKRPTIPLYKARSYCVIKNTKDEVVEPYFSRDLTVKSFGDEEVPKSTITAMYVPDV